MISFDKVIETYQEIPEFEFILKAHNPPSNEHKKNYSLPKNCEVAVLIDIDEAKPIDIKFTNKSNQLMSIN